MGFLDSILKKKKDSPDAAAEEDGKEAVPQPEPSVIAGPKPNPLAKLKGFLDHFEKIVLGLVLVGIATFSVMTLLKSREDIKEIGDGKEPLTLGGKMMVMEDEMPTDLADLIKKSTEAPDAISLKGTNHLVFNPRVWKEIVITNTQPPLLIMDSPNEPLGISALQVTSITNSRAYLTARAFIGGGIVRHEFSWLDREYPVLPYQMMNVGAALNPIKTFFPQRPMPSNLLSASARGWSADPRADPKPLHGFTGRNALYLRFNPEWEVKVRFKSATPASPAQLAAAQARADKTISNVVYDLDIIKGVQNGLSNYETNSVRALSGVPIEEVRGYSANFAYETKYHRKMELQNFRIGRHLMIDGEVFRVFRITADTVFLVSDLLYGGNGKIYEKQVQRVVAPPAAVPVPAVVPPQLGAGP